MYTCNITMWWSWGITKSTGIFRQDHHFTQGLHELWAKKGQPHRAFFHVSSWCTTKCISIRGKVATTLPTKLLHCHLWGSAERWGMVKCSVSLGPMGRQVKWPAPIGSAVFFWRQGLSTCMQYNLAFGKWLPSAKYTWAIFRNDPVQRYCGLGHASANGTCWLPVLTKPESK